MTSDRWSAPFAASTDSSLWTPTAPPSPADITVRITVDTSAFTASLLALAEAFRTLGYRVRQSPWGVIAQSQLTLARRKPQRAAYPASRHRR